MKDTLAALESGAVEELIVWESLDIARLQLKNKDTGAEKGNTAAQHTTHLHSALHHCTRSQPTHPARSLPRSLPPPAPLECSGVHDGEAGEGAECVEGGRE